jgi:hypothetical protein
MMNKFKEIVDKVAALVNKKGVAGNIAVAAGATPTKAEFDALVADYNKLVAALKSKDANA